MLVIIRSLLFLATLAPIVIACDNPDNDACASVFTVSSADAATFCATYTTASEMQTTDLPAYATYCSMKPKKLSSACGCLVAATTLQTATAVATSGTDDSCDADEPTSTSAPSIPTDSASAVAANTSAPYANETTSTVAEVKSVSSPKADISSAVEAKATSSSAVKTTSSAVVKSTSAASPKATSASAAKATSAAAAGDETACTASEYGQITSVVASCTNIVLDNISAPASSTILLTDLLDGTTVTFAGNTSFGTTFNSDFDPIVISGTDITITGAGGHVISGNGEAYWDGEGSNGGVDKPDHFIVLKDMTNGVVSNLNIENWPVHCFDVTGADGLTITGLTLDNSAGDSPNSASGDLAAAHDSDGFDFSGCSNVVLSNTVVKNQDDCVAITSGSNITVTGMTCSGGHGLSIGSVGGKSDNTVSDITFSDSTVTDSENGCRIKSNADMTGTIENIIYQNIVLSGITDYGIDVQQDYLNGGATGDPTNGVTISGVTFSNVTGTVTSDGENYYVLCGSDSCSDFTFTNVAITGGGTTSTCNFPSTGCLS